MTTTLRSSVLAVAAVKRRAGQWTRRSPVIPVLVAAFTALTLSGCWAGGGGGGGQAPSDAQVNVGLTIPSASSTARCTAKVNWSLSPVSLTGTTGRGTSLSWSTEFTSNPYLDTKFGPTGYACSFNELVGERLRTGTWRFQSSAGPYGGTCELTFREGLNAVGFHAQSGCSG